MATVRKARCRAVLLVAARPAEVGSVTQESVGDAVQGGAPVYTDESNIHVNLERREAPHQTVGEYVCGRAHFNGIESYRSMLKPRY